MESLIFLIFGIMLFDHTEENYFWDNFNWKFTVVALLSVLAARYIGYTRKIQFFTLYVAVFLLTAINNHYTLGSRHVGYKEQLIIVCCFFMNVIFSHLEKPIFLILLQAYGGLRGAIAFSLAFMLLTENDKVKDMFLGATYVIILYTGSLNSAFS